MTHYKSARLRRDCGKPESHQELFMMNRSIWVAAGLATLLVTACSSQKEPAEQVITKIDNTMAAIHDAAVKYTPDALPGVQAQVDAIKQTYAKGDYAAVLVQAPTVNTAVANLRA